MPSINKITQPSIFEFTSLDSFLTRYFYFRKQRNPQFSYQVWAKRLQINAPSILCMVVKGNRVPSLLLAEKIKNEMGLNEREFRYFNLLIDIKKNGHDVIRSLELMKELENAHPNKGFRLIEQDQFRAISNWYHYAILEMVESKLFTENYNQLSQLFEFSVAETELREAVQTLLRLGLLQRNKRGQLLRVPGPITTKSDQQDEGLKIYHEQILKNASSSIRTQKSAEREILGLTLCIKSTRLPEAKKRLRTFVEDFCREFDGGLNSDQVYQLESCFFRLIDLKKESKSRENKK